MYTTTATRTINGPIERVFETVSNVEKFSRAVPHITNVEFLTDEKTGVGARFRETRIMRGKEATTELTVYSTRGWVSCRTRPASQTHANCRSRRSLSPVPE